jgi:ssDNA-binding replication factor A large subunit
MTSEVKMRTNETRRTSILRAAGLSPQAKRDDRTKTMAEKSANSRRTTVIDLLPMRPVPSLELLILRRYPRRFVSTPRYEGTVAAACGRDETGLVGVVLWGEQVDRVRTGDVVRIQGGWCRRHMGELVVSTGKLGRLEVLAG